MHQHVTEFPALGTVIRAVIVGQADQANESFRRVRGYIFDFEQRFSRFIVGNELDRVNRSAGQLTPVSQEMLDLLQAARYAFTISQGLVDITVGRAMFDIGYTASFERLPKKAAIRAHQPPNERTRVRFSDITVDAAKRTIRMPAGTRLDIGGIGKGYLLDQCVTLMQRAGPNFWLSLGGDLIVAGHDAYGRPWPVGVQDPRALERDKKTLVLPIGVHAIAASGTTKRQWATSAGKRHHIIDPRTGTSTATDVAMAMVVTDTGLAADVLAKTAVILGARPALSMFGRFPKTSGLVITVDGTLQATSNLTPYIQS